MMAAIVDSDNTWGANNASSGTNTTKSKAISRRIHRPSRFAIFVSTPGRRSQNGRPPAN